MTSRPSSGFEGINQIIHAANTVRLFLDYDGTLADFAPNPGVIQPDSELIDLANRLVRSNKFLPAVISGRQLEDMRALLPVKGMLLAGTYGAEMQLPDGCQVRAVDFACLRPILEDLIPLWFDLVSGRQGYYLEDKGCALALHARQAPLQDAERILRSAREEIEHLQPGPQFILRTGYRFLEIAPANANKSKAVAEIMERYTPAGALPVYAGDDEMDEEAFMEVKRRSGITLRIGPEQEPTSADARLASYKEMRRWLNELVISPPRD